MGTDGQTREGQLVWLALQEETSVNCELLEKLWNVPECWDKTFNQQSKVICEFLRKRGGKHREESAQPTRVYLLQENQLCLLLPQSEDSCEENLSSYTRTKIRTSLNREKRGAAITLFMRTRMIRLLPLSFMEVWVQKGQSCSVSSISKWDSLCCCCFCCCSTAATIAAAAAVSAAALLLLL